MSFASSRSIDQCTNCARVPHDDHAYDVTLDALAGVKNRQPLLSVNDGSRNHGTVQCNPTQARQIDIPVMLPDSEP
jgi:hypothetical protein